MELGRIGERVRKRVKAAARANGTAPTTELFKYASESTIRTTRQFGANVSGASVDAVIGALKATDEITDETSKFVRDAVVGVIQGTGQVAKISAPVIRDVVSAAIKSSFEQGGDIPEASRRATEGAIVGAASTGIESAQASAQASVGVVEAVRQLGGEFEDVIAPAVHGVIIGVIQTSGSLFEATRNTASSLVTSGARQGYSPTYVARLIIDEVVKASRSYGIDSTDPIAGASEGCIDAARQIDSKTGEEVRSVVSAHSERSAKIGRMKRIRRSISVPLKEVLDSLRTNPQGWRGVALWRAIRMLVQINALDLSAALAYYMLLALLPLIALIILGLSIFIDPGTIREAITNIIIVRYLPSSSEFINEVIDHLLNARLITILTVICTILIGTIALFMAANRGINRVFDTPPKKMLNMTLATIAIAAVTMMLFLLSVSMTATIQIVLSLAGVLPAMDTPAKLMLSLSSGVVQFLFSGLVFVIVYRFLPSQHVSWANATFGGLITVILFELAKHAFFWYISVASYRDLIYGAFYSAIILLIWSHVTGMIFLYGAAIVKQASDLRPDGASEMQQTPTAANGQLPESSNNIEGNMRRAEQTRSRNGL